MTYVTGGLVQANDYNTASTTLGNVWGIGSGAYGYGQDTTYIAPVVAGDLIRNAEWNNLDAILELATQHQNITTYNPASIDSGFTSVIAGTTIKPYGHYVPYIQQATRNTGNTYAVTDSVASTTSYTGIWGHDAARTLSVTQTLTFASADAARYYFNAGGKIKLNFTHTGGNTSRDVLWRNLCNSAGTIEIGYRNTKRLGGDPLATNFTIRNQGNGGYWTITPGTPIEHYRQYPAAGYSEYYGGGGYNYNYHYNYNYIDTLDYIQVLLTTSGSTGSHGGLGTNLIITTNFVNGTMITPAGNDHVSGTTVTSLVKSSPGRTYLPINTWGTASFNGVASLI